MIATATGALDRARGSVLSQTVTLPWPPSVNRYWRTITKTRKGNRWIPLERPRHLISAEGRAYRKDAAALVRLQRLRAYELDERVAVRVVAFCPDMRRRDLDNVNKAPLDVLEETGILRDDSQVDDLRIVRRLDRVRPRLEITLALLLEADELLAQLDELTRIALETVSPLAENRVRVASSLLRARLEGAS